MKRKLDKKRLPEEDAEKKEKNKMDQRKIARS